MKINMKWVGEGKKAMENQVWNFLKLENGRAQCSPFPNKVMRIAQRSWSTRVDLEYNYFFRTGS